MGWLLVPRITRRGIGTELEGYGIAAGVEGREATVFGVRPHDYETNLSTGCTVTESSCSDEFTKKLRMLNADGVEDRSLGRAAGLRMVGLPR